MMLWDEWTTGKRRSIHLVGRCWWEKSKKNKKKKTTWRKKTFSRYIYIHLFVLFSFSFSQCLISRRFSSQPFKKLTTRKRRRLHLSPPLFFFFVFLFFIQRKQHNCNNKPTIIVDLLLTLFSNFIHKLEYVRSSFYCTSPAVFFRFDCEEAHDFLEKCSGNLLFHISFKFVAFLFIALVDIVTHPRNKKGVISSLVLRRCCRPTIRIFHSLRLPKNPNDSLRTQ